ncbi:MAG: succinate dehydrogenase/fumarate reductase iron-sulfur subunit [Actinomycetia bacterium]|nr:succinate dehydrogenase/fumarate reductase iron-sulfur subunit [Actinomycetes bacterium]
MKLTLDIWRQPDAKSAGHFEAYEVDDLDEGMSIPEAFDRLNEHLIEKGEDPVSIESDCREAICGSCGVVIDGKPHGPTPHLTTCMQRMRQFGDGQRLRIEPMRSTAFPVLKDLIVDRSAMDRVIAAGGNVSVEAGSAPDAESQLIDHDLLETALDYAICIGCGCCVAACPNGAANLFTGAKLMHLMLLPIPSVERNRRAERMVAAMEDEFGACSLYGECEAVCPQEIKLTAVAAVQHERLGAFLARRL